MKIAICDDEPAVIELIAGKIRTIDKDIDIRGYTSGEQLLASGEEIDILFLDIQMDGRNGMETAGQLRENGADTIIIFVTALEEYVFQAFDVGAFHYLVKPFSDDKLLEVLQKAVAQRKEQMADQNEERKAIVISSNGKHIQIIPEDIMYAEVFNRKVVIHTVDQAVESYGKLKALQEELGEDFYRTHRAYLVNFKYVRKYDASNIYLEQGRVLMAKQNYSDFVKQYMKYNQRRR